MNGKRASSQNEFSFGIVELIISILIVLFIFLPIILMIMNQFMPDRGSLVAVRNINKMILTLKKDLDSKDELTTIVPIKLADGYSVRDDSQGRKLCLFDENKGKDRKCYHYANIKVTVPSHPITKRELYNAKITLNRKGLTKYEATVVIT